MAFDYEQPREQFTMRQETLTIDTARRLALHAQLLDGVTKLPRGKEGVARTIEILGYVQIDTIAVVERAHHLTVWTRRPDYRHEYLHDLQAKDRRVFEYWGHALSYLPMSDYRFYLARMRRFYDPHGKWEKERFQKYGHLLKPTLERIRKEGPLMCADIASSAGEREGERAVWEGAPNPTKRALEMLFWRGELMIAERQKFARVFDLTERVLPAGVDTSLPNVDEAGRFFVRRALAAHGVARIKEIQDHINAADKKVISTCLKDMVDEHEVLPVQIEGENGKDYYTLSNSLARISKLKAGARRVQLLSPFDNLIIQRDRTRALFGFDYALECYVTPSKRKHGYFVMPILWGDRLVGRLDPKADRKERVLRVCNLILEPKLKDVDELLSTLAEGLRAFARFNNCDRVIIEKATPSKNRAALNRMLRV
jgi:uncharacterized protein YcaQ